MAFPLDTSAVTHGIQLAVAPVFLLTAVSGMIGAVAGRLARIIDRARTVEDRARVSTDDEFLQRAHVELAELRLRGRLAKLSGSAPGEMPDIVLSVPDPLKWKLETLCERDAQGRYTALLDLLRHCIDAAHRLSDDLGALYFTHSLDARHSLGV